MVRIENWKLVHHREGFDQLKGRVYRHPGFPDGADVTTSYLEVFHREQRYARTLNTEYALGTPAEAAPSTPTEPYS